MSRPRVFPNEIYVTVEEAGTDDEWLLVHTDTDDTAIIGEKRRVGRYMLHDVLNVESKIVVNGSGLYTPSTPRKKRA